MTSILKVSDIQGPSSTAVAMSTKPSFFATNNANAWQSFGNTSFNTMPFNTTEHDIGNNYDTSNYKFTAPITGSYYFYMQFLHDATTTSSYGECRFRKNGSTTIAFKHNSFQGDTVALSTVTYLQANDYIEAQGKVGNTNADDWYAINYYAYFCGHLIG